MRRRRLETESDSTPSTSQTKEANTPPPSMVESLQRTHGNRFVANLVATSPLQRLGEVDVAAVPQDEDFGHIAGNPLVGLKTGDGLDFQRRDHRDRVSLLQQSLNEKLGAGLVPDGMFGPKTADALASFQVIVQLPDSQPVDLLTADALLDRETPPPPGELVTDPVARAEVDKRTQLAGVDIELSGETTGAASGPFQLAQALSSGRVGGGAIDAGFRTAAGACDEGGQSLSAAGLAMAAPGPKPAGDVTTPGSNPLTGLRRGDGLEKGTEARRERVRELQTRLNERMQAELKVDGLFGPRTGEALRNFEESIQVEQVEVVDDFTATALELGFIPEEVVVGGGLQLGEAGRQFELLSQSLGMAATGFSISADFTLAALLGSAGDSVLTAGQQLQQAGAAFATGRTSEPVLAGALAIGTAASLLQAAASNIDSASAALGFEAQGDIEGRIGLAKAAEFLTSTAQSWAAASIPLTEAASFIPAATPGG